MLKKKKKHIMSLFQNITQIKVILLIIPNEEKREAKFQGR